MAFKAKNKSKININTKQTIDAKHQDFLDDFNNKSKEIPILESQIVEIEEKIKVMRIESSKNMIVDLEFENKIWNLEEKKSELEKTIDNIKSNTIENNYMLKTSKILSQYYKVQDKEKNSGNLLDYSTSEYYPSSSNGKKKTVMDWFNTPQINNNTTPQDTKSEITNNDTQHLNNNTTTENTNSEHINGTKLNTNINSKLNSTTINNSQTDGTTDGMMNTTIQNENEVIETQKSKSRLYHDYMKIIDKSYIEDIEDELENVNTCKQCNTEMLLNQNAGILICPTCAIVENIIINSDKPSYKDPPKEQTSFCYKRINHLNEFLAQFQAKETTEIPEDVYNEILVEIKKERIENMAEINPDKMRLILRKIKRNDYYEHIPYIINQLNGLPAPVIAPEIEEIIRNMFKSIQVPFVKYCPNNRKNFLSYNYVVYKFFELLELDEYLNCFQLLKSRTKLHQQDIIWKSICKDLGWQFIPSL